VKNIATYIIIHSGYNGGILSLRRNVTSPLIYKCHISTHLQINPSPKEGIFFVLQYEVETLECINPNAETLTLGIEVAK
jgi:hypothetical protein